MSNERRATPPSIATAVGLVALASAMGIGRFAFTPMLPVMQHASNLSLVEGGWIASANYTGYLVGALALTVVNPAPALSARFGLVAVAVLTVAMACTEALTTWLVLRFLAGVASACVLVGVSGWVLPILVREGRARWSGIVFAGVGVGIALAGAIGLAAGIGQTKPATAWLLLGTCAAIAAAITWQKLGRTDTGKLSQAAGRPIAIAGAKRLVLCYGAFGFGYIIPATFLPALAQQVIPDAAVFGWAWPVFGVAAAGSTIAAARWLGRFPPVLVWATSQLVMAAGVIAPAVSSSVAAILVSALCVGATFMVVTMAGIEHARVAAASSAPRLIAAMTAAFAFGQLVGPLTLRASEAGGVALLWPSAFAAAALVASSFALLRSDAQNAARNA
jgi:predicted MFS family arabinose efflux permease